MSSGEIQHPHPYLPLIPTIQFNLFLRGMQSPSGQTLSKDIYTFQKCSLPPPLKKMHPDDILLIKDGFFFLLLDTGSVFSVTTPTDYVNRPIRGLQKSLASPLGQTDCNFLSSGHSCLIPERTLREKMEVLCKSWRLHKAAGPGLSFSLMRQPHILVLTSH